MESKNNIIIRELSQKIPIIFGISTNYQMIKSGWENAKINLIIFVAMN